MHSCAAEDLAVISINGGLRHSSSPSAVVWFLAAARLSDVRQAICQLGLGVKNHHRCVLT